MGSKRNRPKCYHMSFTTGRGIGGWKGANSIHSSSNGSDFIFLIYRVVFRCAFIMTLWRKVSACCVVQLNWIFICIALPYPPLTGLKESTLPRRDLNISLPINSRSVPFLPLNRFIITVFHLPGFLFLFVFTLFILGTFQCLYAHSASLLLGDTSLEKSTHIVPGVSATGGRSYIRLNSCIYK